MLMVRTLDKLQSGDLPVGLHAISQGRPLRVGSYRSSRAVKCMVTIEVVSLTAEIHQDPGLVCSQAGMLSPVESSGKVVPAVLDDGNASPEAKA